MKILQSRSNKILLLAAIFIVPYLAAWLFYWQGPKIRSQTSNNGQLISPVIKLSTIPLKLESGESFSSSKTQGKWIMLYVANNDCDKTCQDNLYKIRQIRLVLQKEMDRIVLKVATTETLSPKVAKAMGTEYKDFQHLFITPGTTLGDGVYLIDPTGNLFMRYQPSITPTAIYEDMQHVLKVSQIG